MFHYALLLIAALLWALPAWAGFSSTPPTQIGFWEKAPVPNQWNEGAGEFSFFTAVRDGADPPTDEPGGGLHFFVPKPNVQPSSVRLVVSLDDFCPDSTGRDWADPEVHIKNEPDAPALSDGDNNDLDWSSDIATAISYDLYPGSVYRYSAIDLDPAAVWTVIQSNTPDTPSAGLTTLAFKVTVDEIADPDTGPCFQYTVNQVTHPWVLEMVWDDLADLNIPAERVTPAWHEVIHVDPDVLGWTVVNVTNPIYGTIDLADNPAVNDHTAIQAAIDANPTNSIIYLPAGTYNINGQVTINFGPGKNNTVLRGDGPASTIIKQSGDNNNAPGYTGGQCIDGPNDGISCTRIDNQNGPTPECAGFWCSAGTRSCDRAVIQAWEDNHPCSPGAPVPWVGGYARGNRNIQVSDVSLFAPGDWIATWQDNETALLDNPDVGGLADACGYVWQEIFQIESINGDLLLIDRPLRHTYAGPNRRIYTLNESLNVGVEDLAITFVNPVLTSNCSPPAGICFNGSVGGWVENVDISDYQEVAVQFRRSARGSVTGSRFGSNLQPSITCNYTVQLARGTSGVMIHDNIFEANAAHIVMQHGASGNIASYNYIFGFDPVGAGRAVFFHGTYPYDNLIEGNDSSLQAGSFEADNYWGRNFQTTWFRNRATTNATGEGSFRTWAQGGRMSTDYDNFMLNSAFAWWGYPGCTYGVDLCSFDNWLGGPRDHSWIERNFWRDATPGSTYGMMLTRPTTDCGTGNGLADCGTGADTNAEGNAAPAGWSGLVFPYSMVEEWNSSTARPPGWCAETPWPAIGADVDDYGGALNKLPAQRREDLDPCT